MSDVLCSVSYSVCLYLPLMDPRRQCRLFFSRTCRRERHGLTAAALPDGPTGFLRGYADLRVRVRVRVRVKVRVRVRDRFQGKF